MSYATCVFPTRPAVFSPLSFRTARGGASPKSSSPPFPRRSDLGPLRPQGIDTTVVFRKPMTQRRMIAHLRRPTTRTPTHKNKGRGRRARASRPPTENTNHGDSQVWGIDRRRGRPRRRHRITRPRCRCTRSCPPVAEPHPRRPARAASRATGAKASPDPAPVILVEETPAPTADVLICVLDQALPDTEPAPPEHRGNRSCHEQRGHVIRFNPATATHEDLGPCPRCHPDRARESAAWVRAPRMVGLLDLPTHAPRIDRAEQCERRIDDPPQSRGADIVYPSWSGR